MRQLVNGANVVPAGPAKLTVEKLPVRPFVAVNVVVYVTCVADADVELKASVAEPTLFGGGPVRL